MKTEQASTGISFLQLLTVLFIGLKLAGTITWSWWWVLSPLWLPICLIIAILAIAFAIYCFVSSK